jgi:hypothetical protein
VFLLTIKTVNGQTLSYKVKEYSIENSQVIFKDRKGLEKRFSTSRVDIEEVEQ